MNEGIKNSKENSFKHENGSQIFEIRFSYWVKTKSNYNILNFVFQFIKKHEIALWVHGLCSTLEHLPFFKTSFE